MEPQEALTFWESCHQSLDHKPELREEFLSRQVLQKILDFPDEDVRACIREEPRLIKILDLLEERQALARESNPPKRVPYGTYGRKEIAGPIGSAQPRQFSDGANERYESKGQRKINPRRKR